MDFPKLSVASAYFREEVFALVVRDILNILFNRMHFKNVLIVNGHGADNQKETLNRITHEYNDGPADKPRVIWVYPGFPRSLLAGAIGHAASEETSMLESCWPGCTDISRLPKEGHLGNADYAIVDGDTFDCSPTPDHSLREEQDPRFHTDVAWGAEQMEMAANEVVEDVRKLWFPAQAGKKA
jgi:creatinine amidohydrolase/Fe(II)-dependent formamide hydrolase-like protein